LGAGHVSDNGPQDGPPGAVLFLCTRNQIRSAMAAELMRMRYGSLVRVESAGIRPGEVVDGMACAVMDEAGGDITGHRPKGLNAFDEDDPPFDLIVSLSPEAHHTALNLVGTRTGAAEYWPTFDPSLAEGSRDQRLMEYRLVRDGLEKKIAARCPRPSTG